MEFDEKLNEILNDPKAMENIKQVAASMFGNEQNSAVRNAEPPQNNGGENDGMSLFENVDPAALFSVMKAFNSNEGDDRSRLLLALKPYLSESRRGRVDSAIKLLRIIKILPLLKEQGILKNLFGM